MDCPKCKNRMTTIECSACNGEVDDWQGAENYCPRCNGEGVDPEERECLSCGYIGLPGIEWS